MSKRYKIDPNQMSFDFEMAEALAQQLEAENRMEDDQDDNGLLP